MYILNLKGVTLNNFKREDYHFKTQYVEEDRTDYTLEKNGFKISIAQFCGPHPYGVTVYSPNGNHGGASGFNTANEALEYLKNIGELNQCLNANLIV